MQRGHLVAIFVACGAQHIGDSGFVLCSWWVCLAIDNLDEPKKLYGVSNCGTLIRTSTGDTELVVPNVSLYPAGL